MDHELLILPPIDTPTLAFARAVIQITLAGLIIWTGRQENQRPGAYWWGLGLAVHGLALLVHNVRIEPLDGLLTILNHMGFGFSSAFLLLGLYRFAGEPVRIWLLALIVLIPALSLLLWEIWMPNGRYRILTTAAGQVVFLVALRLQLSRAPRVEMEGVYRVLRWIVPVYTVILIWAYASVADLLPTTAQVRPGYHGVVFSVSSMVFMLSLAVSFVALQYADMACRHADRSRRDELTGLLNRRGFMQALSGSELHDATAAEPAVPQAVLAIDADHFKAINDGYGHEVGDRVLQAIAVSLQNEARPVDRVARIGGEEFIFLRHGASDREALELAERIRSITESSSVDTPSGPASVTISIGVAIRQHDESIVQSLNRADHALYEAKRSGRNRVALAAGKPIDIVDH